MVEAISAPTLVKEAAHHPSITKWDVLYLITVFIRKCGFLLLVFNISRMNIWVDWVKLIIAQCTVLGIGPIFMILIVGVHPRSSSIFMEKHTAPNRCASRVQVAQGGVTSTHAVSRPESYTFTSTLVGNNALKTSLRLKLIRIGQTLRSSRP